MGAEPGASSRTFRSRSGMSKFSETINSKSLLDTLRPLSTKLRGRCEIPVSRDKSSWLLRTRRDESSQTPYWLEDRGQNHAFRLARVARFQCRRANAN